MGLTSFPQAIQALKENEISLEAATQAIYDQLTSEERLTLLDGDIPDFLLAAFGEGYCFKPWSAGTISRLQIPGLLFSDGPRGSLLGGKGTAFPTPSSRANTFDPELEERIGEAIGAELRSQGANLFGGVCINLTRHPGWGRAQESYGEDPLVLGMFGAALSRGATKNVMACVKHFALNSMENMRFKADVTCNEKTLNECYLPHFKQSIEEGSAECVMTAYNKVNGTHCGESPQLMNIIREQWGFEQVYTISDFVWGIRNGPASVKAGLDVEYPCPAIRAKTLPAALMRGELDQTHIEKPVKRLLAAQLTYYARLRDPAPSDAVICCESHRSLAHDTAVSSMVLLKNKTESGNSILPLDPAHCKKIVVVGALAASTQTGDSGSSNLKDPDVITPLEGIKSIGHGQHVIYHTGKDKAKAARDAASADAVIFVTGFTGQHEGESVASIDRNINDICFHGPFSGQWLVRRLFAWIIWGVSHLGLPLGGDRRDLRLPPKDEELGLALAAAAGNKMVTVISASGTVILPKALREKSAAVLFSGYGGCRFGTALRDVLFGKAEPSGRLSFVIPESMDDLPVWDPSAEHVVYDRWWGYRLMQKNKKRPVHPFGFGLGYGHLKLVQGSLSSTDKFVERFFSVSVKVKNEGEMASSAVVQIYAGKLGSRDEDDYERVLIGFQKQLIQPGQVQEISVKCRLNPIAHFNTTTKKLEVAAGKYVIYGSQHERDPDSESVQVVCEETFSI